MPQFFIDDAFDEGSEIDIRGADARHISQVLRLVPGDWIVLSDGRGRSFRATIREAKPSLVRAAVGEEIVRRDARPPPVLALAIVRRGRFEWALQKAVELGCRRIIPFRSKRTSIRIDNITKKVARWRQIAIEAAKQSGLPFRPAVDEPVEFSALCEAASSFGRSILFYEGETESNLKSLWKGGSEGNGAALLIIGPEGGFTDDEVALARRAGAVTIGLGPQILRAETAAIAALSIWQYELGNMCMG